MKILLFVLATLLILPGCKRCYQCTLVTTTQIPGSNTPIHQTLHEEFCGTRGEMKKYEKAGTGTDATSSQSKETTCR